MPSTKHKSKKGTTSKKTETPVIVTKSKVKAKDSLFARKVAAMNSLLSKAKLLPS
jgi:hypothetical protein